MSLSIESIDVASFVTTAAAEPGEVTTQQTTEPGCYSPLCMPTALPEQCPGTGTSVITVEN